MSKRLYNNIQKKERIVLLLVFIILRIPYLYVFYPGLTIFDSMSSIAQFYGIATKAARLSATPELLLTDHHLLIFTVLMGGFIKFGELLGNQNIGFFMYILLQVIISNGIIVYCLSKLKKEIPLWCFFLMIIIYSFFPQISIWQITMGKDSVFSVFLLLLCVEIYDILKNQGDKDIQGKKAFNLICVSVLCCLTKHQGSIFVLLTAIIILLIYKRRFFYASISLICISIFFMTVYSSVLLNIFGVSRTGRQEALGFAFQATARYAVDYGDEITSEEQEAIERVLPYESLTELYNPRNQNPVKFEYNQKASLSNLFSYFKTFFSQFIKHPDSFFLSIWDNIGDYFIDFRTPIKYVPLFIQDVSIVQENEIISIYNESPYSIRSGYKKRLQEIGNIPIVHVIFTYPFYIYLFIICFLLLFWKKKQEAMISLLPIVLSILLLFISPLVAFRYILPIVYVLPFAIGMAFSR